MDIDFKDIEESLQLTSIMEHLSLAYYGKYAFEEDMFIYRKELNSICVPVDYSNYYYTREEIRTLEANLKERDSDYVIGTILYRGKERVL